MYYKGKPSIPLSTCIFDCHSLVKLQLCGIFNLNLLQNQIISLPNLKKLDVHLPGPDRAFIRTLVRLLKSCPLLEILKLGLEMLVDEFVMDICAPNLKRLTLFMHGTSKSSRFFIDSPRLQGITIRGCLAFYTFVNQQGTLKGANIGFRCSVFECERDYLSPISELFRGIESLFLVDNLAIFNPSLSPY